MMMRIPLLAVGALALALVGAPVQARDVGDALSIPPSGVLGVGDAQLTAAFWVGLQAQPDRVILDRAAIAAQNAKLLQVDPSMHCRPRWIVPGSRDGSTTCRHVRIARCSMSMASR
jgi:hypothetical protein